ncbi:MAG: hypothetical protein ACTS5F_01915 [Candidatus Hodgkinia cicadicola]
MGPERKERERKEAKEKGKKGGEGRLRFAMFGSCFCFLNEKRGGYVSSKELPRVAAHWAEVKRKNAKVDETLMVWSEVWARASSIWKGTFVWGFKRGCRGSFRENEGTSDEIGSLTLT